MNVSVPNRTLIHQIIDQLGPDELRKLWVCVRQLTQESVAPLYEIHGQAITTGVVDLADHHDHYLYGAAKNND
jgi:hypothetical protein